MDQPRDIAAFDQPPCNGRSWRVAHLSDLHVVGERYGFRIESGRSGSLGNERLTLVLMRLDAALPSARCAGRRTDARVTEDLGLDTLGLNHFFHACINIDWRTWQRPTNSGAPEAIPNRGRTRCYQVTEMIL